MFEFQARTSRGEVVSDFVNIQPGYHNQRPIIVDEELQSPDTVTLAYEEEAAVRANGGGLSVSMSAYKSQQPQVHGMIYL